MTRTGLALFSLPLAALCIGLSSAPAHADTVDALSELGSINGIALACQQPALASRARNAVQTGVAKTRDWWYRTTETHEEISVALRFSLSLDGVIAGIPPSFVDLLQKSVTAARDFRPATAGDREQLRDLARKCEALFLREDNKPEPPNTASHVCPYPDHLHECMG